jgi:hypothetical protein
MRGVVELMPAGTNLLQSFEVSLDETQKVGIDYCPEKAGRGVYLPCGFRP